MRTEILFPLLHASALAMVPSVTLCDEILTFTVGFGAGGTSSIAAQMIAEAMPRTGGYTTVVENRPGAGGGVAARWVRNMRSRAFLFMSSTSALQVVPGSDLVPVALLAKFDYVAVTNASEKKTLEEYLHKAKHDLSLQNYATAGGKSIAHLIGAKLFRDVGVPGMHIPYKSSKEAVEAVLRGDVGMAIVPAPDVKDRIDLREVARSGNGIEVGGWLGVFAASATSSEEVSRLSRLLRQASEGASTKFEKVGLRSAWAPGAELGILHRSDYERLQPMLRAIDTQ